LPSRRYFQTRDGIQLPAGGPGRRYWIVSRELCRFFRIAVLREAERTSQLDSVELEIKRLSPFQQTGSHVHLGDDYASAWLWDQRAAEAAGTAIGIDVSKLRVLPETALHPAAEDGIRLVECLDGFEGQYWSRGGLSASRWWSRLPDDRAWVLFARGASAMPDEAGASPPEPVRPPWLERPWTRMRGPRSFSLARLDLRAVAAAVALVFALAYGYEGAGYLHWRANAASVASEIDARAAASEPILAARTAALDNQAAIRALYGLSRFPSQLALMARVAELLPQGQARLDDWLFDGGQLELVIASDQPLDVVNLVRSLEGSGSFVDVAADRTGNNNTLRLRATVVPQ
jgi:hypothetical protein